MNTKLLILLPVILFCFVLGVKAQAPQQFNYQGALRNADGSPVASKTIRLRLSVLDGTDNGTSQYSETRQITTSVLGLYNVAIGSSGALSTTNNFSAITWGGGLKYLKVEVDPNGGTNFITAGASQLLSVPYALYAANASANGKSAYDIWIDAGNTGTQADFLNSLKSDPNAAGDLSGSYPAPKVVKIQGVTLSSIAPTANQVLKFDGVSWIPSTLAAIAGVDVATASPDVIELTNNAGAALKNMTIGVKAGAANSVLVTDANKLVKWQSATDAKLVSGTLSSVTFSTLQDGTNVIPANEVGILKLTVPGANTGDPVFLTNVGDETEYSIVASWVSANNEVSVRLANYQPIPVNISGRQYKILLIQATSN